MIIRGEVIYGFSTCRLVMNATEEEKYQSALALRQCIQDELTGIWCFGRQLDIQVKVWQEDTAPEYMVHHKNLRQVGVILDEDCLVVDAARLLGRTMAEREVETTALLKDVVSAIEYVFYTQRRVWNVVRKRQAEASAETIRKYGSTLKPTSTLTAYHPDDMVEDPDRPGRLITRAEEANRELDRQEAESDNYFMP